MIRSSRSSGPPVQIDSRDVQAWAAREYPYIRAPLKCPALELAHEPSPFALSRLAPDGPVSPEAPEHLPSMRKLALR